MKVNKTNPLSLGLTMMAIAPLVTVREMIKNPGKQAILNGLSVFGAGVLIASEMPTKKIIKHLRK